MIYDILCLLAALSLTAPGDSGVLFDELFTGQTLRFDYYHSGVRAEEHISLDEVRLEGAWPGSRGHLVDKTGLGKYLFIVEDAATGELLYSRGFCSIYGEWETTAEAREGTWRTFHESQRFPEPRAPCRLELKKRSKTGSFETIYTAEVDPGSRFVDRSPIPPQAEVWTVFENGPPPGKVDLLILGDGYTEDELPAYRSRVRELVEVLFETEPFRSRRKDFNVRAIDVTSHAVTSHTAGISDPRRGVWTRSPLGLAFNAFDLPRYVLTQRNRELREIAALAPYDTLVVLGNARKYGGGGIYNLWATCTAGSAEAPYVFVHELGHSFAGLADEYYSSQVAYEDFTPAGVEPWEPNVTALLDPEALKWKDLVDAATPLPTPWDQAAYDKAAREYQKKRMTLLARRASDEEMEAFFKESSRTLGPVLKAQPHAGAVGAFEGASYQAKGLYRPEVDCIMFSRVRGSFCAVCRRAIESAIDRHAE